MQLQNVTALTTVVAHRVCACCGIGQGKAELSVKLDHFYRFGRLPGFSASRNGRQKPNSTASEMLEVTSLTLLQCYQP